MVWRRSERQCITKGGEVTDLSVLKELYEHPNLRNPKSLSDLLGIDVFISTADGEKEPPLVMANTVLSILAADYPVEKSVVYLSDDGGSLLTFEAPQIHKPTLFSLDRSQNPC